MNQQHTPGTWTVRQDPTELRCQAVAAQYEYEPNEFSYIWIAREVSATDAKLIAAAPKMLTVCQKLLEWYLMAKPGDMPPIQAIRLAEEILAKINEE